MSNRYRNFSILFSAVLLAMGVAASAVQADDDRDEGRGDGYGRKYGGENRGKPVQPARLNAKWQQECSSCHIAYAPGLLPAESWRKVMAGLDKHFGTDASLTAQESKEITDWLVSNASNRWSAPTSPLKITDGAWFKRKHDGHEISPSVWKKPQVKSPANCGACHTQAESGDFSERNIRMPR
ncbi:MAG: cytochrome C [Gallionellales bacterium GWA2_60_18]|nr:MAG: cytochrome C [Gallionellales bacterium GWA2_60_18]